MKVFLWGIDKMVGQKCGSTSQMGGFYDHFNKQYAGILQGPKNVMVFFWGGKFWVVFFWGGKFWGISVKLGISMG